MCIVFGMGFFFKNNSDGLRYIAHASVDHINAADKATNEMFSKVDWSTKRRLEAKKRLTKTEKDKLFWIDMQIDSYRVQNAVHTSLAHQYNMMLPCELREYW